MIRSLIFASAFCALAPIAAPAAETDLYWDFLNDRNYMTLTLRHKDPKAPLPFLAACEERGAFKLHIGAPLDKAKAGDIVSLMLESSGKTVQFSGKAVFNEFTKVHELVLETDTGNAVFEVLTTGKPVTITSPNRTDETWPAPDVEQTKVWRDDCTWRSEH